uniref:Uncharacterized protein n=1 Tax=Arundo donax TaxID=35708 RepID=A0A0A9F2U1_ARUDO
MKLLSTNIDVIELTRLPISVWIFIEHFFAYC